MLPLPEWRFRIVLHDALLLCGLYVQTAALLAVRAECRQPPVVFVVHLDVNGRQLQHLLKLGKRALLRFQFGLSTTDSWHGLEIRGNSLANLAQFDQITAAGIATALKHLAESQAGHEVAVLALQRRIGVINDIQILVLKHGALARICIQDVGEHVTLGIIQVAMSRLRCDASVFV